MATDQKISNSNITSVKSNLIHKMSFVSKISVCTKIERLYQKCNMNQKFTDSVFIYDSHKYDPKVQYDSNVH